MSKRQYLANAILWAAAIVASATVGSAAFFSTLLLPVLAVSALFSTLPKPLDGSPTKA